MSQISPNFNHLVQLLDAAELRQRVISHNLANVNTPGYRRLDVDFERTLAQQLLRDGEGETRNIVPQVFEEEGLRTRGDGNNVDIDREIGELNRNAMLFQTYSQLLASQFDQLRRATRST